MSAFTYRYVAYAHIADVDTYRQMTTDEARAESLTRGILERLGAVLDLFVYFENIFRCGPKAHQDRSLDPKPSTLNAKP